MVLWDKVLCDSGGREVGAGDSCHVVAIVKNQAEIIASAPLPSSPIFLSPEPLVQGMYYPQSRTIFTPHLNFSGTLPPLGSPR